MKPNALVINEADDVAVALEDIPEGGTRAWPTGAR